jgi:hypothetical protein
MNLREQFKDMFFSENYGYTEPSKRDEVRTILMPTSGGGMGSSYEEGWELMAGSWDSYRSLISTVKSGTMDASKYAKVKEQVDISSITDFFCLISFGDAVSWGHNQDLYKMPGDKWKWLVTDFDRAWTYGGSGMGSMGGVTHNLFSGGAGTSSSIVPGDTLFSKLIANSEFKSYFVQRYAAHLNSTLKPSRLTAIVDSIAKILEPEMADHAAKWITQGGIKSLSAWKSDVSEVRKFMEERADNVWEHLTATPFSVKDGKGAVTITFSPADAKADIFINGVRMSQGISNISMFKGMPFTIKATGKSGWKCSGWADTKADSITVTITGATTYTCKFEKGTGINPDNYQIKTISGNHITSFASTSNGKNVLSFNCAFENPEQLEITLFDLTGRSVGLLLNKGLNAGFHQIHLPVTKCVSGVYFYKIKGSTFSKNGMLTVK